MLPQIRKVFVKDSYQVTMSFRRFRHVSSFVKHCLRPQVDHSLWCSLDLPFIHSNSTTNERKRSGHLHWKLWRLSVTAAVLGDLACPCFLSGPIRRFPQNEFHKCRCCQRAAGGNLKFT